MTGISKDRIRELISRVTEANLHSVCYDIHYHIQPDGHREVIHTIADSVIDEAAGSGHTLVPQYRLAGVCRMIDDLCNAPTRGAGTFLSISLPQMLDRLCQGKFVDASRKLECDEDVETTSSVVLDLVVLVGELYKVGLVKDEVVKEVYLDGLCPGYNGSDVKAGALCLLLELLATRWDMYPTTMVIDVEWHIRSLLNYAERQDSPSALVDEIKGIATQFGVQPRPPQPSPPRYSSGSDPSHASPPVPPRPSSPSTGIPDNAERHPVYFFRDGNVDLICRSDDRRVIFRLHVQQLIQHSPTLSGLLSQDKFHLVPAFEGRPQIPWDDDPVEFATLVEVFYKKELPFMPNRPPFREFSSLLRLSSKYQIRGLQDALQDNLRTTYTPSQNGGAVTPIHHGHFGDPQPHPNEVLKLFHECRVDFALAFAFYEACVAGIKSLTNTDPSVKLPPVALSQAVRGFCTLKEWEWRLSRSILFLDRQSHTSNRCRPLDIRSTDSGSPLQDVLRAIYPGFGMTAGGILHITDFPNGGNCADCVRRWNDIKQQAKEELWKSLPEIFGMEPLT